MNFQSKNGHRLFFCYYCLQYFTSEEILKNHAKGCFKINGAQKVKMPQKDIKKQQQQQQKKKKKKKKKNRK